MLIRSAQRGSATIIAFFCFFTFNLKAQNQSFKKAFDAYFQYDYAKSIELFIQAKAQSTDPKVELKSDAFIAISNIYLGEYGKAINGLNDGFVKASNLYGDNSLEISDFYLGFGKYYEILEVYDTALIFNNAAMALKQNYLKEDHRDFIDVYTNIGIAYDYSGAYDSAIVYYQRGLNASVKNLGEEHPYTEYLYNDMGVVYGFLEQHEKALDMARRAFAVRRALYGESSSEVAQSYHNIAVSLDAMNRYSEALTSFQKSFEMKKELFSKKSTQMAAAHYSLGNSYSRNNQFSKAIFHNKEALSIAKELEGEQGKLTLKYLQNLGNVNFDGGMYDEAIKHYSKSIEIISAYGGLNQELSKLHLYLGQAYENIRAYKKAELNFNQALNYSKDEDTIIYNVLISLARMEDLRSNYKESLRLLNEALKIVGENSSEAGFIFNNLASVFIHISNYESAKTNLDKSIEVRQRFFGDNSNELAQTFSTYGNYYFELEKYNESFEYYKKSYEIKKKNYPANHPVLSSALFNLSAAYGHLGKYQLELESLKKILKMNEKNYGNNYSGNASIYLNLCLLYDRQGKIKEAIEYGDLSVKINSATFGEQSEQTANALAALATVQHNFGRTKESLENAQRALFIYESLFGSDHVKTANQYNNLGVAFMDTQEFEKSRSYFNRALSVYEKKFGMSSSYVASTLANLALIEYLNSDYDKAIELFQNSIELGQNLGETYKMKQSIAYQNLSLCYTFNQQPEQSILYARKALKLKKKLLGNEHYEVADVMINIGNHHLKELSYDSAEYYFTNAQLIYNVFYGNKGERVAGVLNNLSDLYMKTKKYNKALAFNKKALESNKNNNGEINSFRQAFVSQVSTSDINYLLYKRHNDLKYLSAARESTFVADKLLQKAELELFREDDKIAFSIHKTLLTNISIKNAKALYAATGDTKYVNEALYFAERSKSGVLLSSLKLSNVKQFDGVDNDLIAKEKSLLGSIQQVNEQLFKLNAVKDSEKIAGLNNKLFELNRELETIKKIEQERFPKYYDMNNTSLVNLSVLQNSLKHKPNMAFVEYALSDSTLHAIVITSDKQSVFSMPLDEKFEKKLLAFRKAVMFKADNVLNIISEKIYTVVFEPIEQFFESEELTIDELTIVPEGALNYMPFEALFRNVNGNHQYLIEDYAVSYTYSLSLYNFITNRTNNPTENSCLAFAPVFPESSPSSTMNQEAKSLFASASSSMEDPSRAFTRNGAFISALPGTEVEVRSIHDIATSSGVTSKYFIYEQAEEKKLKTGILKNHRYLHFATHGFINESNPAFSGILMSQNKESKEDCILYASEIYNLEVNAELVTLSACETGLGKMAFGEGIVGLTRSFLYAGASNLLVSQWKVNDETTSKMMIQFYDKVFSGQAKPQALREAKLSILKDDRFKNPYYWAPFVLIGK